MSLLAHGGSGIINTWGFAYVGGVIGLVGAGLYVVQRAVVLRSSASPSVASASPMRWIVVVGLVCGVSLGLGIGRLAESLADGTPSASDLAQRLCRVDATESAITGTDISDADLHDDLDHFVTDRHDLDVADAHAALDDALASDQAAVPTAIAQLVEALERSAGLSATTGCVSI